MEDRMSDDELPHLDPKGRARMVDVGEKQETHRIAVAEARVRMAPATVLLLTEGKIEKGDALAVARIAGIAAAKRTPDLIPLAHPILIHHVAVEVELEADAVRIEARVETHGKTGVEMEAMTAASVAALSLYDMIKKVDRSASFEVQLVSKSGGRSGSWHR
jgi:cyclic pyranopterin monophosphate synthase